MRTIPLPTRSDFKDLTGRVFERLTVIAYAGRRNGKSAWKCWCECGKSKTVTAHNLTRGYHKSCGCLRWELLRRRKRPQRAVRIAPAPPSPPPRPAAPSKTFISWRAMRVRCNASSGRMWRLYGERGIRVCDRWNASFQNFVADMGERPEGKTLDRIDNDLGYEPSNCRWATPKEQRANQRSHASSVSV